MAGRMMVMRMRLCVVVALVPRRHERRSDGAAQRVQSLQRTHLRFGIVGCWDRKDVCVNCMLLCNESAVQQRDHKSTHTLTQQRDERQLVDVEMVWGAGVLQSTGGRAHLDFGHVQIATIEHHAHETRLTVADKNDLWGGGGE